MIDKFTLRASANRQQPQTDVFELKTSAGWQDVEVTWTASLCDYPEGDQWQIDIVEMDCLDDDWPDCADQAIDKILEMRDE